MKTKPMLHQETGLSHLQHNDAFMLACEQGTGKTWMLLADAETRFLAGQIDGLLVVAPNGVHTNWVKREIPLHLGVPHEAIAYTSGAGKAATARIDNLIASKRHVLHILTINIDALSTEKGYDTCVRFLKAFRCVMVIDESAKIKNPTALRTKRATDLGKLAKVRRCASGTPITNGPGDAYCQFNFLQANMLGYTSHRAFFLRYTEVLPPTNPLVLAAITGWNASAVTRYRAAVASGDPQEIAATMAVVARIAPLIAARDQTTGRPRLKNLPELQERLAPHMYRVTKDECLDLPAKIYQTQYFDITPAQRKVYAYMDNNMRYVDADGNINLFNAMTKLTKLQQITSGFVMAGKSLEYLEDGDTPRIKALLEIIESTDGQFIVWARYREEIAHIVRVLKAKGISCVEYHGGIDKKHREEAIDKLQRCEVRGFISNVASGGTGLTLTAAETVIYYSNTFEMDARLQSEDRAHRIGTTNHVRYIDIVANETIDEKIAAALQSKEEVAAFLLNDKPRKAA
jgi:SNF2 family DNA or RNA helicase